MPAFERQIVDQLRNQMIMPYQSQVQVALDSFRKEINTTHAAIEQ